MNLKDILYDKMGGQYDYKLNDVYYQIYKFKSYWIVYETERTECGTPFDWIIVSCTGTLKEAKKQLQKHLSK
tara:strand:+ start:381 stop:596 length:216 start_codon:yes stop_codon:yes gene_type:complete